MTQMLKVKHAAIQVLPMRTRAVATLMIDVQPLLPQHDISPQATPE